MPSKAMYNHTGGQICKMLLIPTGTEAKNDKMVSYKKSAMLAT